VEEYGRESEAQNRENGRSPCARWRVGFCTILFRESVGWGRGGSAVILIVGMNPVMPSVTSDSEG
jgi:hypothetical protein